MVKYESDEVFPAPLASVWKLLAAHQVDGTIPAIHHLVLSQQTIEPGTPESIVERIIDVRGRPYRSRWKLDYRPPEFSRWEVISGEGPWRTGSFVENHYSEAPGGTRIVSRGELHIHVLPSFLPQGWFLRRVFSDIDAEDRAYLRKLVPA